MTEVNKEIVTRFNVRYLFINLFIYFSAQHIQLFKYSVEKKKTKKKKKKKNKTKQQQQKKKKKKKKKLKTQVHLLF